MSVGKRVAEAIDKMAANDPEAALFQIASALDATAVAEFGVGGRGSYKRFIAENMKLITQVAFGNPIENVNLGYSHPKIQQATKGACSLQDIFYHAIRCGLVHNASIPSDIEFVDDPSFGYSSTGTLQLNKSLVYGFIIAVVVAPTNRSERIGSHYGAIINASPRLQFAIDRLWGQRKQLTRLLAGVRKRQLKMSQAGNSQTP